MKTLKVATTLFLFAVFSIATVFGQTKDLSITVKNIGEVKGDILVYIYDKKENFPKEGKFYKLLKFPVKSIEMPITIKDLPVQDYAINLVHDLDSNGECNRTRIGFPIERIGFSNNIKPKMKIPSFESAKIAKEVTNISIELYEF